MRKKKEKNVKKILLASVVIFIIIAIISLIIILSKGKIGNYSLVYSGKTEESGELEEIKPIMELSSEKKYISVVAKEITPLTVKIDGVEQTEGIELVSSNEDVVKIVDGEAKAVKKGSSTITASKDGLLDSINIHVITPIKTIKLVSTSSSIKVGEELQLSVQVTPSDASTDTLTYKSSDETIATVDSNAMIIGVSKGKVTFTVYDEYTGKESSATVPVK